MHQANLCEGVKRLSLKASTRTPKNFELLTRAPGCTGYAKKTPGSGSVAIASS